MAGVVSSIKRRLDALEEKANKQSTARTQGRGVKWSDGEVEVYSPTRSLSPVQSGGTGWSPDIWKPVIATGLSVEGQAYTAGALLSVDNCVMMAGRSFQNFGSMSPRDDAVLSGYVFAVIDHPIWAGGRPQMVCYLSCADSINGMTTFNENYSILPLYYITADGTLSVDYRGMPTVTMWS